VLGVALALLEVSGYEAATAELEEIVWLKQAEGRFSISESARAAFLARADLFAASPLSLAVTNQTAGRPKRILAQAMAQHLRAGGFTHRQVAEFMGTTIDVTRGRCKVQGVRSLAAVVWPESASTS
jgi:hypothetical protein